MLRFACDLDSLEEPDRKTVQKHFSESKLELLGITEIKDADILLCFNDREVLRSLDKHTILAVELPGDNSFFAQLNLNQLPLVLKLIQENRFYKSSRDLLEVTIDNETYLALNDFLITSTVVNSRIRYDILVANHSLFEEAVDSSNGILISTPTGSTAMAMNLGGGLIHSNAQVFQIQTIASRNFFARQHIVSNQDSIHIEILDAAFPLFIQLDSRRIETESREFMITKAKHQLVFLEFDLNPLARRLQEKVLFEDTANLTSSAKFILHVLRSSNRSMTIAEIMEQTQIKNRKTVSSSLNLLVRKGFANKKDNLEDMRENLYQSII